MFDRSYSRVEWLNNVLMWYPSYLLIANPKKISKKLNTVSVAAHLRGMRSAPTSQKDTLMLREKLKL